MNNPERTTLVTLSNAVALSCAVIEDLAGVEIGETINGTLVSRQTLSDLCCAEISRSYQAILTAPAA